MFMLDVHVHVLERSGFWSSYNSMSQISYQFLFLPGTIQMEIFTISGFPQVRIHTYERSKYRITSYHVSESLQTLYWVNNKHCLV